MLPDFPTTRKKLDEITKMQLQIGMQHDLGLLSQIPYKVTPEGDSNRLVREDGTSEPVATRKIGAKIEIPVAEAENWTAEQSMRKLAEVSGEMARQKSSFVIETLNDAVEKVGNVLDAKGNFNPSHYFELISKIRMDFRPDGTPHMPQVVGGNITKIIEVEAKILADPKLRDQLDQIIGKKREEWRAREANRTLVG